MSVEDDALDRELEETAAVLERARVRLAEIAKRAGLSKSKVREDVKRGDLKVHRVPCGTRWMAMVDQEEAARYLAKLFPAA